MKLIKNSGTDRVIDELRKESGPNRVLNQEPGHVPALVPRDEDRYRACRGRSRVASGSSWSPKKPVRSP